MDGARLARIVSFLTILFGAFALVRPIEVAQLADIGPGSGNGWSEVGALYGGLPVAMGLVGLRAARRSATDGPVLLLALAVLWFGIAAGRLTVSLTAPESIGVLGIGAFALEIVAGSALFWSGWTLGYER